MAFDVVIHKYVNNDPFFIAQIASAVAGDTNNTVSVRVTSRFRDMRLTILTTLDKNALTVMTDLITVLPKGITVDVSGRTPTDKETATIKAYLTD